MALYPVPQSRRELGFCLVFASTASFYPSIGNEGLFVLQWQLQEYRYYQFSLDHHDCWQIAAPVH
jgi:hypothetical protein